MKKKRIAAFASILLLCACDTRSAEDVAAKTQMAFNGTVCPTYAASAAIAMKLGGWRFRIPNTFEFRGTDGPMARFVQGSPSNPSEYSILHVGPAELFGSKSRADETTFVAPNGLTVSLVADGSQLKNLTTYQATTKTGRHGLTITSSNIAQIGQIIGCSRKEE